LPGGHLQTLWPNIFGRKYALDLRRERLWLKDGDFIDLDWLDSDIEKPLIVMLPGLEGSIKSSYAQGMMKALQHAELSTVFMCFRGCSGEHNKHINTYHAGQTQDLKYLLDTITDRYPKRTICAIGFSLGGNILLKYLGETQNNNPLHCAVAISIPFQLERSADRLQQGFSRLYQKILLSSLVSKIKDKHQSTSLPVDLTKLDKVSSFWAFDDLVTAPLNGFKNVDEYYQQSSCRQFLPNIKKNTLIIHATNDPFLYPDAIPQQEELTANVELEIYKSGGHIGFVAGMIPFKPRYWLEQTVPEYLCAQL
jgi:predicted alpha/beta-fold hydrolase